uniref:hypothetical protein n=1 Tax=uncultured Flavonifractor sp. TaxID=1193534 RepID=UPI002627C274|nr:hypothetical protein [uncultured Flavonifractor sp.]
MAYFKVNPAATNVSALQEIGRILDELQNQTNQVRSSISFRIRCREQIDAKLRRSVARMQRERNDAQHMANGMSRVMRLYEKAEREITGKYTDSSGQIDEDGHLSSEASGGQPIFDESGRDGYGGDQGELAHEHNGWKLPWGWVWFEDKDVYRFVKEHEGFENYSEAQIHDLIKRMNQEGCGYIGAVNAIFAQYKGSAKEFEQTFGFPMLDEDGNYNYNYMFIDLYCTTDNKYYLGEPQGVTALVIEKLCAYETRMAEFKEKYGCVLGTYDADGNLQISEEARLAMINEINSSYDANEVVTFDKSRDGLTVFAQENHIRAYLEEKGINPDHLSYSVVSSVNSNQIQSDINSGKTAQVLLLSGTEMHHENGGSQSLSGGHYVTITDVTEDGKYIVSSWGEKYYIDPKQAKIATYQTIDIKF